MPSRLNAQMTPGTKVQLSGNFLRATGQTTGPEAASTWTVQDCSCELCRDGVTVAVDEPRSDLSYWSPEELVQMPYLKMRHIHRSNLVIKGSPSLRNG